jgi:hypothetical protein
MIYATRLQGFLQEKERNTCHMFDWAWEKTKISSAENTTI